MIPPPQPPQEATDIFSISDQVLADRLQFIEEIGFGNWGSVWLCRPKGESSSSQLQDNKIAVKLVHRSKTSTTAARVRSLWNEMKTVRALKQEPHPSIIPFYSFIITPSYALITMAYHPRLITVEVSEQHAKEWFRSLLSGVEFLHKRGVVHNDIKPANILLSSENVPVLVDFGFAERYDVSAPEAFHSNLSYGTPEYLSPERARGLPHDTRKSDVWSLGVTFFEILVGRTPFEHPNGEQFATKGDLEKYWARTLRGKWVGAWKMSKGVERLLRRMIAPNADLRCTASEAMDDAYWTAAKADEQGPPARHAHKKSASVSHSRTSSLALDIMSPWASRASRERGHKDANKEKDKDKDKSKNKPASAATVGKENAMGVSARKDKDAQARSGHARSQSQPRLQLAPEARGVNQTKRPAVFSALSPIKHSPPAQTHTVPFAAATTSALAKENSLAQENSFASMTASADAGNGKTAASRSTRKPLGPRSPAGTPPSSLRGYASKENAHARTAQAENDYVKENRKEKRRSQILRDVTQSENVSVHSSTRGDRDKPREKAERVPANTSADTSKDSVRSRMKEWERERERLREMERRKECMREVEEERECEKEVGRERAREEERERVRLEAEERERLEEEQRWREQLRLERERERRREREAQRQGSEEGPYVLPKISVGPSLTPPGTALATPLSPLFEEPTPVDEPPQANESSISVLKQSLRMSIGNAVRLYKSSTQLLGRSTPALTLGSDHGDEDSQSLSEQPSWDDDEGTPFVACIAVRWNLTSPTAANEQQQAENRMDRMTIWIQSVEKVVDEARQNFAASTSSGPAPALPIAPMSRGSSYSRSRGNRIPRKILAANQIFVNDYEPEASSNRHSAAFSMDRSAASMSPLPSPSYLNAARFQDQTLPTIPSEAPSGAVEPLSQSLSYADLPRRADSMGPTIVLSSPQTPRKRRATVVTRSPENGRKALSLEIDVSPSKRREKSRSHGDLLRPITPVTKLEFELERLAQPTPTPRLSTVVDKNLFISSPIQKVADEAAPRSTPQSQRSKDALTESPLHVDTYPTKTAPKESIAIDTPAKRHLEGVYDRFLMSTTGVRRNGKGYQSENVMRPIENIRPHSSMAKRSQKFFPTGRRQMPPPVSSDDLRRSSSVDEFGAFLSTPAPNQEQNNNTIAIVRKAFKAIVTGKPHARTTKPAWH
ncbi:hypothetical protein BD310DRAFT_948155 [Dichomitus squalens]|uniref:Protein kinase domain-containing protein n=1 Tax=Dichomitus squalens TaxID=114155 RepID=A0A4Q9PWZ8_9APHY|nr:hypothetical protein BD310DRAFT_948155 [Dichomitus squalens]